MAIDILRLVAGLVILIVAADRLVLSAVRLARLLNISVVIIGAVIVGFGTSVPEFVVSGIAASSGNLELAMSNVVASNTANTTLVLGAAAVIAFVATTRRMMRREGLLMVVAVVALAIVLANNTVGRVEGVMLLIAMVVALVLLVRWARQEPEPFDDDFDFDGEEVHFWRETLLGGVALLATVLAGQQMLIGVEGIGDELGFSVVIMGLITGVGTSLPELSAAIAGARRKHTDLVVGNVLGSNIFNSLGVAGFAAVLGPGSVDEVTNVLLGLMIVAAVLSGVFAFTRQVITRIEGIALIGVFALYLAASV